MAGNSELVKLCSFSHVLPVYDCDTGEALKEVVMINAHGEVIPHDSETYPAPPDTFTGDGSGFIRSYFTDLAGNPIADADRPTNWSYDPDCQVTTVPDVELGCYYNPADPESEPIPGYTVCVTTIVSAEGEEGAACSLGSANLAGTGAANDGVFGLGDPGSGLPSIVRYIKVGGATNAAIAAAIAGGYNVIEFIVDGANTYSVYAADLTAPADNASGVWVVSDAQPDECGFRVLWAAEDNIDVDVVVNGYNATLNEAGEGVGGTPSTTCTYYDADGNEVTLSEELVWDSNCDRFDYEEVGPLCVRNAAGEIIATVKQVSVYDTQVSNGGTNLAIKSYLLEFATGAQFILAAGDVLGSCVDKDPLVTYGCLYRADGNTVQVWQEIPYLSTGYAYSAPVYYTATTAPGGGAPVTLVQGDEFQPGACKISCPTCLPLVLESPCLTGTGTSPEGRLKYDVNPGSLSQGTMDGSYIQVTFADQACNASSGGQFPITGTLTVVAASNGDPSVENFVTAFNAIGGAFSATAVGLDDEGTNSIMCVTVPTGLGNITLTIVTPGGGAWNLTWDDAAAEWTGVDDQNNAVNGSATNC